MAKINTLLDQRISEIILLKVPSKLMKKLPQTDKSVDTVTRGRRGIERIMDHQDERIFISMGQCAEYDYDEAMDNTKWMLSLSNDVSDSILIVGRRYHEKPRSGEGWEGLITDPNMDGNNDVNLGYYLSRKILLAVANLGLPSSTEYLESFTPQYNSDLISLAVIGARTAYSPQHRRMASGQSMPVGIKNDTHGDIGIAVGGVLYSTHKHIFQGITMNGKPAIFKTTGNPYSHLVLRGGDSGPNYKAHNVEDAQELLKKKGLAPNVVIDCSHGNSGKDYTKQPEVFEAGIEQIRRGNRGIVGFQLEVNIKPGSQSKNIPENLTGFDRRTLEYGISATDGCMDREIARKMILDAYKTLNRSSVSLSRT